jgi:hypothetical protein
MPGVGTTHHILLDGHYYLVKPGSYQKRVAPTFGARFSTGDPDFNNMSMWQHWAQRCFIGGMDSPNWGDDAMYDDGVGVNTTEHDWVTLSRDLGKGAGSNWDISKGTTAASVGYKWCLYNNKLYVLTMGSAASKIWEYDPATDGWTDRTGSSAIIGRSIAAFDGKIWIGGRNSGDTASRLIYSSGATLATWTAITVPSGAVAHVSALRAFQQKLYACYGPSIYRYKENAAGSGYEQDGTTAFYKATQNSESNKIIALEVHLGFLYGLSDNGHVHRTDGNQTFDIWNWDGGTRGVALKSFDGRLFVITYEYTNTAEVGMGVLYQMSGSAMTELKRWGKDTESNIIGSLTVYDRKLFYGASNLLGMTDRVGFGVAIYDPVEDAHSIVASNTDTATYSRGSSPYVNYIVDDVIFHQAKMFVAVRGHGAFYTPYKFRDYTVGTRTYDRTANGGSVASKNGGWLTTSTYDAGTPGVRKLWRKIVVDYTIPSAAASIFVEYSTDNGATFSSTNAGAITTVGTRVRKEFWLNNQVSTSLKLRFTLRSTTATVTPTLFGYVVSYIPEPEPNWMWDFTIVLSEKQVLLDGTIATVATETELTFLSTSYRNKLLLSFTDAEGQVWASNGPGVLIYDMRVALPDLTQPLEGEVNLTLLEAVETY